MRKTTQEKRKKFVKTTEELFYKRGYKDTSIKDICEALETTTGSFYFMFDSKEGILEEIVKDYYDDLYYIRRDIEDCLLNKGYTISNEQKTVEKQDYDYCVSLVHSMRNIPNIPELESIAVLPYPKEITQYDPNLSSY